MSSGKVGTHSVYSMYILYNVYSMHNMYKINNMYSKCDVYGMYSCTYVRMHNYSLYLVPCT